MHELKIKKNREMLSLPFNYNTNVMTQNIPKQIKTSAQISIKITSMIRERRRHRRHII